MITNSRLNNIGEYHFKKIDDLKEKILSSGKEIVDLSIGDPDIKVDDKIINKLKEALQYETFNNYAPYGGIKELKKEIIRYYDEVYSVKLTMDEVIVLIGSKEGLSNIIPAVCSFGDYILTLNPGYPVYSTCASLWGCNFSNVTIHEGNNYMPRLENIPREMLYLSKLFMINYPNNPTGATADEEFYKDIVKLCYNYNILLCNDGAYNEILSDYRKPISLLQFDHKKRFVEFGTLSKTYNMTGFRIGYAVGNEDIIKALLIIKSNIDSSQFKPIQYAACEALKLDRSYVNSIRKIYFERKIDAAKILRSKGIKFFDSKGTFYLWCKVPDKYTTDEFVLELLNDYGILVTPGYGFGTFGDGYFRIALTKDKGKINNALSKLKHFS